MTENSSIQMSQGYDVLPPKTGKAYPILCEEWEYLKKNVDSISEKPNIYHTIGSVLLGVCLSTFIAILTGSFPSSDAQTTSPRLIIAYAVVAVTFIVSAISFYFAYEQRKVNKMKASDILNQMKLIERRYQTEEDILEKFRLARYHVEKQLKQRPGSRASFEAIRAEVNKEYTDDFLKELIDRNPEVFRTVTIKKGHKLGITLAGELPEDTQVN